VKQLFLVRHAKSGHDDSHQPDILRTLNSRGLNDAPAMAKLFASQFKSPDAWFSSPAVRAMETAKFFAKASAKPFDDIAIAPALYSFELKQVAKLIESSDDRNNGAIYFFHNPTISEIILHYTGESRDVPTCTVAMIEFDVNSWQHVTAESGALKHFDYPKKHL